MSTRRSRLHFNGRSTKEEDDRRSIPVTSKTVRELCFLRSEFAAETTVLGVVLMHGSWNKLHMSRVHTFLARLTESVIVRQGLDCTPFSAAVHVDQSDESVALLIGEDFLDNDRLPLPPGEFPVLAVIVQNGLMERSIIRYVRNLPAIDLIRSINELRRFDSYYASKVMRPVQSVVEEVELQFNIPTDARKASADALRIFVAGDRSSVGKSSVCLGILGYLIAAGYAPETLAYIKPATQSESTQLIQLYCERQGIPCVPVGPLVYYRGFTRAFLAGETESTEQLLNQCGQAVDRVARGKKVVLIDGVGFPAVGSICGTSNAAVARSCGYPEYEPRKPMGVVLVGGSGVGAAVDAFNLNATYFEQAGVPVLGGLFNKLSETGFYSLENCRAQITAYFDQSEEQNRKGRRPFGFVPLFSKITGKHAMDHVEEYFRIFGTHVDVQSILDAAQVVKASTTDSPSTEVVQIQQSGVRRKRLEAGSSLYHPPIRSRQEVEALAVAAGAAPSA